MNRSHDARPVAARSPRAQRRGRRCAGMLGILASVTCAGSMILASVGVGGATAAASMASMTAGPAAPGGAIGALTRAGPWLMAVSVPLVTVAFAMSRRPLAAIPALLAGAVLYAGMYAQHNTAVMDASIAAGYLAWAALTLWVRPRRDKAAADRPVAVSGTPPANTHLPDAKE